MSEWPPICRCLRCGGGHPFGTLCPSSATAEDRRRHAERLVVAIDIAAIVALVRQVDVFAAIEGLGVPEQAAETVGRLLFDFEDPRAALIVAIQALRNLTIGDPDRLYGALGLDGAVPELWGEVVSTNPDVEVAREIVEPRSAAHDAEGLTEHGRDELADEILALCAAAKELDASTSEIRLDFERTVDPVGRRNLLERLEVLEELRTQKTLAALRAARRYWLRAADAPEEP